MRVSGIGSAPQSVLDALGKCEVCGEQATGIAKEVEEADVPTLLVNDLPISLITHHLCDEHWRCF